MGGRHIIGIEKLFVNLRLIERCVFNSICLSAVLITGQGIASEPSIAATNVLNRVIDRASQVARSGNDRKYTYAKRALVQELNSKGEVIESTEKKYKVLLIRGWPFSRLVEVQGQKLSEAELQKEDQKEEEFRKKVAGRDLSKMREKKEAWLKPELVERFDFTVLSNAVYANRDTIVLEFKPRPGEPEKTVQDKIYNRIAGLLWIDQEDAEIARIDAHLIEDLSLGWFGMLGSLKTCDLTIERKRMPEGVWVNGKQILMMVGRKVFSSMRYRAVEESSGFQHEP